MTAASFLRNSQALSLLLDATRDKDWRVAVSAIRALSRFFPDNPMPIYDAALRLLHTPQYHLQKETLLDACTPPPAPRRWLKTRYFNHYY
jgi:hypothetical protein